jgi:glycosyltransferase involved in cell wall biosynthesis
MRPPGKGWKDRFLQGSSMMDIRFSIIIPSYNQREFIKDAVDSALSQRNAQTEIIVADDGSTDGTQEILRQYGDAIRFVCFETNQGAGAARNCGAALARGEYLVFLDGDDVFLPWALEAFERIIQAKKPKLILGGVWPFKGMLPALQPGDTPHEIRILEFQDYLRRDRHFTRIHCQVIDRQAFQGVQGWPTDYQVMQDMDFLLRISTCGRTILILEPPIKFYRVHAANDLKHKCVPPYLLALRKIIGNERSGKYPGGERRSLERQAFIGRLVVLWAREAAKAGLYWDAIKLLARGWPMALAAVTRRLGFVLKRRQPCETIKM